MALAKLYQLVTSRIASDQGAARALPVLRAAGTRMPQDSILRHLQDVARDLAARV